MLENNERLPRDTQEPLSLMVVSHSVVYGAAPFPIDQEGEGDGIATTFLTFHHRRKRIHLRRARSLLGAPSSGCRDREEILAGEDSMAKNMNAEFRVDLSGI